MPRIPANQPDHLHLREEQEREQQEEAPVQEPKGRLMTVLQVLAIVIAMTLAVYNNALIGDLPTQKATPYALLVESEPFDPVPPCNEGGTRISSGTDINQNGQLDAGEITDALTLCHGLRGLSGPQGQPGLDGVDAIPQLLVSQALPIGNATCPTGGTNLSSGMDFNADGELSALEITSTANLCNGAVGQTGVNGTNGVDGTVGASALVEKVIAPSYICLDGFQILFGVDDGGLQGVPNNGMLEDDEVRESLNFCFEPLRSERITDIVSGITDSVSDTCDAAAWLEASATFVFAATDGTNGCELHRYTANGNTSEMVVDLHPNGDSTPGQALGFHALQDGNQVLFDANDGANGRQLWVSDGTAEGTNILGSVEMTTPVSWNDGYVFFSPTGGLVWTNGSDLRDWLQHPTWNSSQSSGASDALSSTSQHGGSWLHGGETGLWFSTTDAQGDVEPAYVSNNGDVVFWSLNNFGDAELTHMIEDGQDMVAIAMRGTAKQLVRLAADGTHAWITSISPTSGDTRMGEGMGLHRIGDNLVYDAVASSNDARLWTTNLANGITVQLSTELMAPGAQVGVANNGERLLFDCVTPTRGTEICFTDATPLGSGVLHDLTPGVLSSDIRGLLAIGDGFVVVSDGSIEGTSTGMSVWTVQGTAIRPVYNPWPGSGNSSQALTFGELHLAQTQLFFIASDGVTGHEWHRWSHGELSNDWIVIDR